MEKEERVSSMKAGSIFLFGTIAVLMAVTPAQAQEGTSSNAVGFEMAVVARNSLGLLRYDFESLVGNPTPDNVFGLTSLPIGTTLYIWDAAGSRYALEALSSNKVSGLCWSPGTNYLNRGIGFWLKIPSNAPESQYSVYMVGEMPRPVVTIDILEGYNLIGYPYPVAVTWSNTILSQISVIGDSLYTFSGGGYQINMLSSNKASGVRWSMPTQVLHATEGYWFKRTTGAGTLHWMETKPYTWP